MRIALTKASVEALVELIDAQRPQEMGKQKSRAVWSAREQFAAALHRVRVGQPKTGDHDYADD